DTVHELVPLVLGGATQRPLVVSALGVGLELLQARLERRVLVAQPVARLLGVGAEAGLGLELAAQARELLVGLAGAAPRGGQLRAPAAAGHSGRLELGATRAGRAQLVAELRDLRLCRRGVAGAGLRRRGEPRDVGLERLEPRDLGLEPLHAPRLGLERLEP